MGASSFADLWRGDAIFFGGGGFGDGSLSSLFFRGHDGGEPLGGFGKIEVIFRVDSRFSVKSFDWRLTTASAALGGGGGGIALGAEDVLGRIAADLVGTASFEGSAASGRGERPGGGPSRNPGAVGGDNPIPGG